jgi:hypothetical protein
MEDIAIHQIRFAVSSKFYSHGPPCLPTIHIVDKTFSDIHLCWLTTSCSIVCCVLTYDVLLYRLLRVDLRRLALSFVACWLTTSCSIVCCVLTYDVLLYCLLRVDLRRLALSFVAFTRTCFECFKLFNSLFCMQYSI